MTLVLPVFKKLIRMSAKRKAAVASAIAAAVLVLFPNVGDSIILLINTVLDVVPVITTRQP